MGFSLAGLAVGAYSANRANKNAKDQNRSARRAADAQADVAHRQLDMAEEQWDRYKELYDPLERGLLSDAQKGIDANKHIGMAVTDVSQNFAAQKGAQQRDMARYGLNPASGRWQGADRQMGIAEALGKSQAANTTRMAVDDANWARRSSVANMGRGLPNSAMGGMASAAGALGNSANMQMGMAQASGNDAGQWAQFGLNAADKWLNRPQQPAHSSGHQANLSAGTFDNPGSGW